MITASHEEKQWTISSLLIESTRLQKILEPLFTWEYLLESANDW